METNHERAIRLAGQGYTTITKRSTTDGDDIVYIAHSPDLVGCHAQGDTPEEARKNLDETRIDVIRYMLDDGVHVPAPKLLKIGGNASPIFRVTLA